MPSFGLQTLEGGDLLFKLNLYALCSVQDVKLFLNSKTVTF